MLFRKRVPESTDIESLVREKINTDDAIRSVHWRRTASQLTAAQELRTDVSDLRNDLVKELVALHNVVVDLGKALVSELNDIKNLIESRQDRKPD